jgi:hypothetical protein
MIVISLSLFLHLPIHLSESISLCISPLYLVLIILILLITILAVLIFHLIFVFFLVHMLLLLLLLAFIFVVHIVHFILLLIFIVILLLLHLLLLLLLLNHELLFLFTCILHLLLLLLWVRVALHILKIVQIWLRILLDLLGLSLFPHANSLMPWSTEGSDLLFLLCWLAKHQELIFRCPSFQLLSFKLFITLKVANPKLTNSSGIFIWVTIVIGSLMQRSHLSECLARKTASQTLSSSGTDTVKEVRIPAISVTISTNHALKVDIFVIRNFPALLIVCGLCFLKLIKQQFVFIDNFGKASDSIGAIQTIVRVEPLRISSSQTCCCLTT